MAEALCAGFRAHDDARYSDAVEAFYAVDRRQFPRLEDADVRDGATAYADALWAKDAAESECRNADGTLRAVDLADADWGAVHRCFRRRADALGIDPAYAKKSALAWRRHKTGGDYWTPMQEAQLYELRAALGTDRYPDKPSEGQSGFGPEAARYALGVELHDMHTSHHWAQAVAVMTPYYERILREHRDRDRRDAARSSPRSI
ncbi:hypothetical protein [Halegenticoccus soli]|uniref:hypothetical protein n=1 Tax=Halegenticoccus soli TaxID=1985678 RepID=UPI0018ECA585|nr:hypothetical protein [Halegenticoccus soli]